SMDCLAAASLAAPDPRTAAVSSTLRAMVAMNTVILCPGRVGRHRFSGGLSRNDQPTITGGVVSLALSQTSWSLSDTKRSYASGQCMVGLSGSAAGCATGGAGLSKGAGVFRAFTLFMR